MSSTLRGQLPNREPAALARPTEHMDSLDSASPSDADSEFEESPKRPASSKTKTKTKPAVLQSRKNLAVDVNVRASTGNRANARPLPGALEDDRPVEEVYQKKTQLEHILLRPDTYIGSVECQAQLMWVYDQTAGRMVQRSLSFVPGLFKIFDEILVNAADNKIRDPAMDTLRVDIDKENARISIFNNGRGIPIEVHAKEHVHVPELIFGHLLTSSNYDDAQKKVTGGRNGYGAKLCNIFSKEFVVETADSRRKKKYKQVFSANMSKRGEPAITDYDKEDFTRISFRPDLAKFGMECIDEDIAALFERRVYDMAGCISNVKVFLNGERIKVKNFKHYVELFTPKPEPAENLSTSSSTPLPPPLIVHEKVDDRWEICVAASEGQFQQVSFVNSICTYKGGTHVNYIAEQIINALHESIKKKSKDMANLKPFQIKNHLSLFINCLIENPTFDSQTKENMTLRASAFGSKCHITEELVKKILKCGIVENVMSWARFKQDQQLKKTDGAKKSRLSGITKLDDANNAGTKNAGRCTLIITEGDSAKALAVSGLSVVGRDNYGVFPLRGKLLNVREATHKQIMENTEINHLKQILGLQHGKAYPSADTLRYGSLMIMTDQDHDGSHIKGLVINFLDHFFPSLLQLPGFLVEFITPIVKVTRGKQEIAFYTIPEYESWKAMNGEGHGWTIKYYKGLGTSTAADAKKYFGAMGKHRKLFARADTEDRQLVDMAFNKKRADERKEWLKTCTASTFVDHSGEIIKISDFINKELILFSMADNIRSIPSVVDGLKPGHRKILFSCFKRKLKGEIKVAQLAGYVSEHSAYHHGEQSLCSTIVGMAQNFVGSNNINFLEPIGQFGTRLQGGKDAASPRYIFTSLSPFSRVLYKGEDDALLKYLNDDGQSIEPEWYIPIIPMVLVNGGEGIGTGWMTSIPNFNPRDIVRNLERMMDGEEPVLMHPWYHGFRGSVEMISPEKYKISGIWHKVNETTLEITELPIGVWTQSYKEMLEGMLSGSEKTESFIKDYKEYHTDTTVKFVVTMTEANMRLAESEGIEKKFKLSSAVNLANLVCFDPSGRIKRYESPIKIIQEFFHLRLEYYTKRKDWMADQLTREWTRLDNRVRFVQEIVDGRLIVQNRPKNQIIEELALKGYTPFAKEGVNGAAVAEVEEDSEAGTDAETGGVMPASSSAGKKSVAFEYLMAMPIYSLTKEKIESLKAERGEKEAQLNDLLDQTPKDLWRQDLQALMAAWESYESENGEASELAASGILLGKPKTKRAPNKKPSVTADDEDTNEQKPLSLSTSGTKNIKKPTLPKKTQTASYSTSTSETVSPADTNSQISVVEYKSTVPAPVLDIDDINSLPLSERINYMLQRAADSKKPAGRSQTTLNFVNPTAGHTTKKEAVVALAPPKTTRRIIAKDSDSDDASSSTVASQQTALHPRSRPVRSKTPPNAPKQADLTTESEEDSVMTASKRRAILDSDEDVYQE